MDSLLLRTAVRLLLPLQLLFSVFVMLRGHNEPGGGFVGGLIAGASIVLWALAHGMPSARKKMRVSPHFLIALGLLCAASSGIIALVAGYPFLTGLWSDIAIPTLVIGKMKLGTPVLFDVGVYFLVCGIAIAIIFALGDDEETPIQPKDRKN
ncbi:Na+/H+ antiporter subunit B [Phragmitibacter flavus]|uniref:Na+/H+ antiporter subunit B n=1 Tax=Phragmitibacter flavus TaxID=2576071 RepID=A0A5R8KA03_9BACT|nr:Na+/H+ antiporter subunit B [Phragmitibacter flavus]TLD69162.1 Na+/H+ antiporter subunit B [Phragmitibacter flavus]